MENKDGYKVLGWKKCHRCKEWKPLKRMCQEYKCLKCSRMGETCIVW